MRALRAILSYLILVNAVAQVKGELGRLVKKEDRRQILTTTSGEISSVEISFEDGGPGKQIHHLHLISINPDSIFLPALLHSDMVLYIHAGGGTLSYTDGDDMEATRVSKGDVYRLRSGSVFYIQSSQESGQAESTLRLFAVFQETGDGVGPYSGIGDLFQGFGTRLLQAAFQAPEEVMEEISKAAKMDAIVPGRKALNSLLWKKEAVFLRESNVLAESNKKHKEHKRQEDASFNLLKAKRNVQNCNGWSAAVTPKDLHGVKEGWAIQAFMLNLNTGAIAGPSWNPSGTEIAVVVEGRGMVRAVCPGSSSTRFGVEKGDVFGMPRLHPMARVSFNNESLVLMGFSVPTGARGRRPQFLAGKDSFLRAVDRRILQLVFNVDNTTISRLMASRTTDPIQQCVSCAEEEQQRMIDEEEMGRAKERKRRQEEERERSQEEEEEGESEWERWEPPSTRKPKPEESR